MIFLAAKEKRGSVKTAPPVQSLYKVPRAFQINKLPVLYRKRVKLTPLAIGNMRKHHMHGFSNPSLDTSLVILLLPVLGKLCRRVWRFCYKQ